MCLLWDNGRRALWNVSSAVESAQVRSALDNKHWSIGIVATFYIGTVFAFNGNFAVLNFKIREHRPY